MILSNLVIYAGPRFSKNKFQSMFINWWGRKEFLVKLLLAFIIGK